MAFGIKKFGTHGKSGGIKDVFGILPNISLQYNRIIDLWIDLITSITGDFSFLRGSIATITDFEGLIKSTNIDEARFKGARRVENLTDGTHVAQNITVEVGREYQVTIGSVSAIGATAVCSGAFTGTLTGDALNRIAIGTTGAPSAATTTTLTITITGSITELFVEDVTGQANQNPSDYIDASIEHGAGVNGVKCYDFENGNTVGHGATSQSDIAFSSDGTKYFSVGFLNKKIFEYDLPTAYEVENRVFTGKSFDFSTETSSVKKVVFSPDGTKAIALSSGSNSLYEYDLSTGFDLDTISYSGNSFSVAAQETSVEGLAINSLGTKLFIAGRSTDNVYEYDLSTGFALTTISYSGDSFSIVGQELSVRAIDINPSGTKLFMIGSTSDTVFEYDFSVAFSVTSLSYSGDSFSVAGQDTLPKAIRFDPTGLLMWIVGDLNDKVFEYDLAISFSVTSIVYNGVSVDTFLNYVVFEKEGVDIAPSILDGLLIEGQRTNYIIQSDTFSAAQWVNSGTTDLSNTIVAPDGTISADSILETNTLDHHTIYQTMVDTLNDYVGSIYVKRRSLSDRQFVYMQMWDDAVNRVSVLVDLDNGSVVDVDYSGAILSNIIYGASIDDNGWVHLWCGFTKTIDSSNLVLIGISDSETPVWGVDSAIVYSGNSSKGVYVWGGKHELGLFPSSYIPTAAVAVTRAADTNSVPFPSTADLTVGITFTPITDFINLAITDVRLFGTDDSRGTSNEVTTIGHATTYGATTSGGNVVFQISQADFLKDDTYEIMFSAAQEGANIRLKISVDGLGKLNTTVVGVLDHTNSGTFTLGYYNSNYPFISVERFLVN